MRTKGDTMSIAENKEGIRRWVEEVWNKGNLNVADSILSDNHVLHDPTMSGREIRGITDLKSYIAAYREAHPGFTLLLQDLIAEGDTVVWRFAGIGSQLESSLGSDPAARVTTTAGTVVSRFADENRNETLASYDTLGIVKRAMAIASVPRLKMVETWVSYSSIDALRPVDLRPTSNQPRLAQPSVSSSSRRSVTCWSR
jgi:hypothetical protein